MSSYGQGSLVVSHIEFLERLIRPKVCDPIVTAVEDALVGRLELKRLHNQGDFLVRSLLMAKSLRGEACKVHSYKVAVVAWLWFRYTNPNCAISLATQSQMSCQSIISCLEQKVTLAEWNSHVHVIANQTKAERLVIAVHTVELEWQVTFTIVVFVFIQQVTTNWQCPISGCEIIHDSWNGLNGVRRCFVGCRGIARADHNKAPHKRRHYRYQQ